MVLLVYLDDIVLASNDAHASEVFNGYLNAYFSVKNLGPLRYFLRIEVSRGSKGCSHVKENMHWRY